MSTISFPQGELTPGTFVLNLFRNPKQVLEAYFLGRISTLAMLIWSAIFLLLASLVFTITAVLGASLGWIHFLDIWALTFFLFMPILTAFWALIQRLAAWFFDIPITLRQTIAIAGVGQVYYITILLISLPILLLQARLPYWSDTVLFFLNISAFMMSIRLFQQAYLLKSDYGFRKTVLIALTPIGIVIVLVVITQLLAWVAAMHHM